MHCFYNNQIVKPNGELMSRIVSFKNIASNLNFSYFSTLQLANILSKKVLTKRRKPSIFTITLRLATSSKFKRCNYSDTQTLTHTQTLRNPMHVENQPDRGQCAGRRQRGCNNRSSWQTFLSLCISCRLDHRAKLRR